MTYTPLYELLNDSSIAGQHFIDWCSGDALNERWETSSSGSGGSGAVSMDDAINGGILFKTFTSVNAISRISWNNNRTLSKTGSVLLGHIQAQEGTERSCSIGMGGNLNVNDDAIYCQDTTQNSFIVMITDNASTVTSVSSSVSSGGTDGRQVKLQQESSAGKMWINGSFECLSTTNLASIDMQAGSLVQNRDNIHERNLNLRYVEAYNT